jgi:cold shock CspA family protein
MGRSQETFSKKEREKKKRKKRQDKQERKEERKSNNLKGKPLEEMFSYVDENGNVTSTPPDPTKKKKIVKLEDIMISVPKQDPSEKVDPTRTGKITHFNDAKGFGFIRDDQSQDSVFVHMNDMIDQVRENARVSFRVERGHKGPSAVEVREIE